MLLVTLPLVIAAAPLLLMLRSHTGWRTFVLLAVTLFVPMTLPPFLDGLLGYHRSGGTLWHPHVAAFGRTVAYVAPVALTIAALNLPVLLWRTFGADQVEPWSFGAFVWTPTSIASLLVDAARGAALVFLAPSLLRLLDDRAPAWPPYVAVMAIASLLLVALAHRNGNVIPGFGTGSLLARVQPLWRHTARIIARVRRSRDGLGAIFSRRPKDLRAIASGSTPRT